MANKKRKNKRSGDSGAPADLSPEEQASRREQQRREWAEQKRVRDRAAQGGPPYFWIGGGVAALVGVVAVAFLLIGGSGGDDGDAGTPTPDPRVGNAAPVETLEIAADDGGQAVNPRFQPNTLNARAGEVFEVVLTNNGSVHHNFNIAGNDREYGTPDDWVMDSVAAGDVGRIKVKLNDPGTYPFRCDLHPQVQLGTLVLS